MRTLRRPGPIYGTDPEHKQDARPPPPPTATYRDLGCRLVEVPRGGVAERAAFVVAEACR